MWQWHECEDYREFTGTAKTVNDWSAAAQRYVAVDSGASLTYRLSINPGGVWAVSVRYRVPGNTGAILEVAAEGEDGDPKTKRLALLPCGSDRQWRWARWQFRLGCGESSLSMRVLEGSSQLDGFFVHSEPMRLPERVEPLHAMVSVQESAGIHEGPDRLLAAPSAEGGVRVRTCFPSETAHIAAGAKWSVIQSLAAKTCPYLVKDYASGAGTDYNSDTVWHLLHKEKLWRIDPHGGRAGVFNPNSDLFYTLGIRRGEGKRLDFPSVLRTAVHTADLCVGSLDVGAGLSVEVVFHALRSDALLVALMVRNDGAEAETVSVADALGKGPCSNPPPQRYCLPDQKFGTGVETTAGGPAWRGASPDGRRAAACLYEWVRGRCRGRRLLASIESEPPSGVTLPDMTGAAPDLLVRESHPVSIEPGVMREFRFALTLRRFTTGDTWNPDIAPQWYHAETEDEAAARAYSACSDVFGCDLYAAIAESISRYCDYPELDLPEKRWQNHFHACLEVVRASAFSPLGALDTPFYNFCRVHAHEPFNWWSYGMHAHESLIVLFQNYVDPSLSADFLRGHMQFQTPEGKYPYGVSHTTSVRTQTEEATLPVLVWEAWQTFLWSGDREFLREAFESGRRNLEWYLRTRDRCGEGLCHYINYSWETSRDDNGLPTWRLTGGAQYQEALDLNCYLRVQELTLAAMARELGLPAESERLSALARKRAELMNAYMWHADDSCYYGIGEVVPCWANVRDISTFYPLWAGIAPAGRFESIAALAADPDTFGTPFGPPTLARNEPGFGAEKHWFGSNWVEMTLFVILGLRRYGYYGLAARLAHQNAAMVFDELDRSGHFREYFNSLDGRGVDLIDYNWTAMPAHFLVGILLGITPTSDGLEVLPAFPADWDRMGISGLRIRGRRVTVRVRRYKALRATEASMDGSPAEVVGGRGVFVPWEQVAEGTVIEISQPWHLAERPAASGEAPSDWSDVPPHAYPDDPDLVKAAKEAMIDKESLRREYAQG